MDLATPEALELLERIVAMTDRSRLISKSPAQPGTFVVTGMQQRLTSPFNIIGYTVQVREAVGQFGSDMVFLRHPAGNLNTHENQHFLPMSAEQEVLARQLFKILPDEEDHTHPYKCCNGVEETGYWVKGSQSPAAENTTPFMLRTQDADGKQTLTAFL